MYNNPLHKHSFAAHSFASRKNLGFSIEMYSKFKHGSKNSARFMGRELAEEFISTHGEELVNINKQIVIISSPYSFIPTATSALKDYFIPNINKFLISNDKAPVFDLKISRGNSYTMDYSSMSFEDRQKNIGGEKFHIDKEFVKDKFIIFMDDIRITGSHELMILKMVQDNNLVEQGTEYMFLYYAELLGDKEDPKIEQYLNLYAMKDIYSISDIIKDEIFIFNTRNVKFMLDRPSEEFKNFIRFQSKTFIETLYHFAIGNSYHLCDDFKENFYYLQNTITWHN